MTLDTESLSNSGQHKWKLIFLQAYEHGHQICYKYASLHFLMISFFCFFFFPGVIEVAVGQFTMMSRYLETWRFTGGCTGFGLPNQQVIIFHCFLMPAAEARYWLWSPLIIHLPSGYRKLFPWAWTLLFTSIPAWVPRESVSHDPKNKWTVNVTCANVSHYIRRFSWYSIVYKTKTLAIIERKPN